MINTTLSLQFNIGIIFDPLVGSSWVNLLVLFFDLVNLQLIQIVLSFWAIFCTILIFHILEQTWIYRMYVFFFLVLDQLDLQSYCSSISINPAVELSPQLPRLVLRALMVTLELYGYYYIYLCSFQLFLQKLNGFPTLLAFGVKLNYNQKGQKSFYLQQLLFSQSTALIILLLLDFFQFC